MAKKQKEEEIINIHETYGRAESFIENNKKLVSGLVFGILALVLAFFLYKNLIQKPKELRAQNAIFAAQNYFQTDSFNLVLNGDGINAGSLEIAEDYKGTKAGNLAKFYSGISYMHLKNYEEAVGYLKDFCACNDPVLKSVSYGALGDAYSELDDADQAITYYKKAANADPNYFASPVFLLKAGKVMEFTEDYSGAAEMYKQIKMKYPESPEAADIERFLRRVQDKL